MLKQKILASNVVFTSIFHSGKYLNEYKKAIIPIFNKLSEFQKNEDSVDIHLKGNVSNSGFGRMN